MHSSIQTSNIREILPNHPLVVISNTKLTATATTSGVTLDADTLFYIRPTANKVLPVGFTENGHPVPSDAVTNNFLFYGSYLMHEESGGYLSDSFRLKETNISGVYRVYWDESNLYPSGYLLPIVKSLTSCGSTEQEDIWRNCIQDSIHDSSE